MSARPFAPPDLLAAIAMATAGDLDVPDGVHLRVMPSPVLGFPLAPFGVYRIRPEVMDPEVVLWRDRHGAFLPSGDLDDAGGYLTADWATPGDVVDVAVQVLTDETLEGTVSLLDRAGDRVIAQASREPFIVGGPRVDRIRIEGRAAGLVGLLVWRIFGSSAVESIMGGDPDDLLSLPIDGERKWYAGGLGEPHAMDVVRSGAPQRLAAPDRPDGPLDALTRDDEALRVEAFRDRLLDACEQMLADPATFPTQVRLPHDEPAGNGKPRQIIDLAVASTLLAQAMDPGLGRFLGLVGHGRERVDEPTAYAVIGLFAIDRRLVLPDGRRLAAVVDALPPMVGQAAETFARRIGAEELITALREEWGEDVVSIHGLIALAGAIPPPDRPVTPRPRVGTARWLDGQGVPSSAFRQELLVDRAPLGSLIGLGRLDNGGWTTRHQTIELPPPADPEQRAVALLLGRTGERPPLVPSGLVSDAPVPAGAGTRYRLALADLFGRFGKPTELEVPDPPRPKPPAPAPQVEIVLDGPHGNEPGSASPGHIVVRVPVPSVAERTSGSLLITGMHFALDGESHGPVHIQPPDPGEIAIAEDRFDLPELTVGERRSLSLNGVFIDTAGEGGEVGQVPVTVTDRRRPPTLVTARGIVWTSRPGPSPDVELRLTWPGAAGVAYRAYIADAKSLGLAGTTRADVAKAGGDRDEAGTLGGRDRFRLLTEPPLVAGADGRVTMVELLPRSLASVQFVRIVPVTAAGRDAEFGRCRAIPVAVPTDRRPPAPRVRAEVVAGQRHATIRIEAVGLDLVALQAAEPGLFTDPPTADALAPEFRLRRAAGAVGDPLYAREVARGRLERTVVDDAIIFAATIEDPDELAPFVRASYWAEVRMPPERRLIRGADVEIPPAGGVVPLHPAQLADMPGPFSAPSAPSTVLGPAGPPVDALDGAAAAVAAEAGGLRMSLTAPSTPAAHPLAAPGYRLRIWERWGAGDLALVIPDVPLTGGPLDWIGSPHPDAPRAQPAALLYAIVDPLGRVGPLHELAAPLFVWESLGGIFTSAPAACAPAPGQLAALGAGLDQRLYARRFDGTWAPSWDLIALDLVTGPLAVASPADGTIVLATRGADEDPRYFRYDGATWTAWQPAGWFTTGVALVALSPTDVRIFATRYSRIWFASWNGAAWSAWQRLPADPLPAVDVAATAVGGQIDLAVRGSDHRVRHRASADGTWGPWTPLGDFAAASAPAIARLSPSELVVFARGADAGLHWNRLGPAGPTGWTHVGTAPIAGAPAATSPSPGRVDVFVQGTDNAMYHRWYDGSWHP